MALLLLAVCVPRVPVVTAMALVALGATDVTLARFRGTPAMVPILFLHATTYGGMYAVFVGAALDAATSSSAAGLGLPTALDLVASILPAAAMVRRIGIAVRAPLLPKR